MGEYVLAVDVGTFRVSAAVARKATTGEISTTSVALGRARDAAPATVFVGDSGLQFGDAADRRALVQPDRALRAVSTRIGDDAPFVVGDRRLMPADVFAAIIGWVVESVKDRESADPSAIAVTVPATWGDYRTDLVRAALERAGLTGVALTSGAEAAAAEYETATPLRPGRALAVYDLGGGGFEAVVLRKERGSDRLRIAGTPLAADDAAGVDVDDAVLARVLQSTGLTATSPEFLGAPPLAAAALRRECIEAKEALSFDSETVVPVIVGQGGSVRLTRGELEAMIEPIVERTMETLTRVIESARISAAELDAVLLVGGSSRIPRVAQMLSERFDRPVVVEVDPKAVVTVGAARALGAVALGADTTAPLAHAAIGAAPAAVARRRSWLRRTAPAAATGTAVLVLAAGIVVSSGSSLASGSASLTLAGGNSILSLSALEAAARADRGAAIAAPAPPAAAAEEPADDWASPRTTSPDRKPAAPRSAAPDTRREPVPAKSTGPSSSSGTTPANPSTPATKPSATPKPSATTPPPAAADDPGPATPADPVVTDPGPGPDPDTPPAHTPEPQPEPQPEPEPEPEPQPEPSPSTTQTTEPAEEHAP